MKKRLDVVLVERGLVETREKARALIMAGHVLLKGEKADKAGESVGEGDAIVVNSARMRYVSRGGYKLEKALEAFNISLHDRICCDFGASTGGFTDCMLQNNARIVYAFDVGYGQLAWSLRQDPRVVNYERVNVRYVTPQEYQLPPIDFLSADLSFISLNLIFPVIRLVLKPKGESICLVKPQFEAGRESVGKKGVVKSPEVHIAVLEKSIFQANEQGFFVKGLSFSPLKGPEGNIEYLLYLSNSPSAIESDKTSAVDIVLSAHKELHEKGHL